MGNGRLFKVSCVLFCFASVGCKEPSLYLLHSPSYTIIYAAQDGYIYEMEADGSNKRKLFDVPGRSPLASPKGGQIAAYALLNAPRGEWLVLFDVQSGNLDKVAFVK